MAWYVLPITKDKLPKHLAKSQTLFDGYYIAALMNKVVGEFRKKEQRQNGPEIKKVRLIWLKLTD